MSPSKQSEYLRLLDGQARFFTSQVTAHVGYFLTTIVILVAGFNILYSAASKGLNVAWSLLCFTVLVVTFLLFFRFASFHYSPKYFFARIQYYIALCEIVWEHTPFFSTYPHDDLYYVLMRRTLNLLTPEGARLGVRNAVMEFFEARLYVSCKSKGYELSSEERSLFRLSEYCRKFRAVSGYSNQKALFWDKTELLFLAYGDRIEADLRTSGGRRYEIAKKLSAARSRKWEMGNGNRTF